MKVFRCRICGEAYLGEEKPHSCPFCGAHNNFLLPASDWKEENKNIELSEISRKNLETTLDLEIASAQFYKAAYGKSKDPEIEAMFKTLAKVEAEHADVACKLLGIESKEEARKTGTCNESDLENVTESKTREKRAVELYSKFKEEATEQRVKTVFGALVDIESDHIEIDDVELNKISKN